MKIEDAIKQKEFQNDHVKASVNLIYTAEWFNGLIKQVLDEFGITHVQYNILRILAGAKSPLSPGDIRKVMIFKSSDITRLMDRLVSKGLIDRVLCPTNRRKMDISINKNGVGLLEQIAPKILHITESSFASNLSDQEVNSFNDYLNRIRSNE